MKKNIISQDLLLKNTGINFITKGNLKSSLIEFFNF